MKPLITKNTDIKEAMLCSRYERPARIEDPAQRAFVGAILSSEKGLKTAHT
jgi:hypothetical protein